MGMMPMNGRGTARVGTCVAISRRRENSSEDQRSGCYGQISTGAIVVALHSG